MKINAYSRWAIGLLCLVPLCFLIAEKTQHRIDSGFSYSADIFSVDNLYNEEERRYYGEVISKSIFSFEVEKVIGSQFLVQNDFAVSKLDGTPIFQVSRNYGVDADGRHVPKLGDHPRNGFLFAPLVPNQKEFTYWHVNYDSPAKMTLMGQENLFGLAVNRYECNYEADQTESLTHLPGVPELRGIELDIYLQLWVEPLTGRLIKYEDYTTAWYYNIQTGERLHPWNTFHNEFSSSSVVKQVNHARDQIFTQNLFQIYLPLGLLLIALTLFFTQTAYWKRIVNQYGSVGLASLIFLLGGLICLYTFYRINSFSEIDEIERTENLSREVINSFQRELDVCTESLEFLRYQYQFKGVLKEDEFSRIANRLVNRTTSINGITWVPKVCHKNRRLVEKTLGKEFYQRGGPNGANRRDKEDFYFPIVYAVPITKNKEAIGFDISSRPSTKATAQKASELNEILASPPIVLVQEKEKGQFGVVLMNPVFHNDSDSLLGLVNGVVRLKDIATTALSRFNIVQQLVVKIYDVSRTDRKLIFSNKQRSNSLKEGILLSKNIPVLGRIWQIEIIRPPLPVNSSAVVVLVVGLLVSLLAAILIYKVLNDKSESLRLSNEQLALNSEVLLKRNRDLEEFVYIASHDLQEPARTIHSFVGLLQDESDNIESEDAKKYISFSATAADRLNNLIMALGEFIRVGLTENKSEINASSLVSNLLTLNEELQDLKGATVICHLLPTVYTYRHELEVVFTHLIQNAVKFRKKGHPPHIEINSVVSDENFTFSITDRGIGFNMEHKEQIFGIFRRLHLPDDLPGTGMGLSICRKAVEHMKGEIWAESNSLGSTFYFTIPRK